MKAGNIVQEKSFAFAIEIVKTCQYLNEEKKEFVLSKQLLRSGTSVGANIEEAIGAQSSKDFLHKMSISYKEARETRYWINLLKETNYLTNDNAIPLINNVDELCRIIGKIQTTTKEKAKTK